MTQLEAQLQQVKSSYDHDVAGKNDVLRVEIAVADARQAVIRADGASELSLSQLALDDGTVITESIAICRYFEALHPEPPLFGRGALEAALVEMWQRRVELHLLFPVAMVFQHTHPAMKIMVDPQVAAWGEANKPRITEFLQFLDGELKNRSYVAGKNYTVADITAMIAVDFMRVSKLKVPDELTNVKRWHAEVSSRPSAAA